jgi:hypothetical protein
MAISQSFEPLHCNNRIQKAPGAAECPLVAHLRHFVRSVGGEWLIAGSVLFFLLLI